jgi:predicted DNA-binding protein YlxM (UPF0122 family)
MERVILDDLPVKDAAKENGITSSAIYRAIKVDGLDLRDFVKPPTK